MPLTTGSSEFSIRDFSRLHYTGNTFETFENPSASMPSYTIQAKSDCYKRSRHTCISMCRKSGRLVQDGDDPSCLGGSTKMY